MANGNIHSVSYKSSRLGLPATESQHKRIMPVIHPSDHEGSQRLEERKAVFLRGTGPGNNQERISWMQGERCSESGHPLSGQLHHRKTISPSGLPWWLSW